MSKIPNRPESKLLLGLSLAEKLEKVRYGRKTSDKEWVKEASAHLADIFFPGKWVSNFASSSSGDPEITKAKHQDLFWKQLHRCGKNEAEIVAGLRKVADRLEGIFKPNKDPYVALTCLVHDLERKKKLPPTPAEIVEFCGLSATPIKAKKLLTYLDRAKFWKHLADWDYRSGESNEKFFRYTSTLSPNLADWPRVFLILLTRKLAIGSTPPVPVLMKYLEKLGIRTTHSNVQRYLAYLELHALPAPNPRSPSPKSAR